MKFDGNPYYSPEKYGLAIFDEIDNADSYEYDKFVIWEKLDDKTLWWDTDSGCSCPSPFDNDDHGHDLKQITRETFSSFDEALKNHSRVTPQQYIDTYKKVREYLKIKRLPKLK